MNQEKEMTQMCNSAGEYLAPKVEVVEIKVWRVMCGSFDGGLPKMDWSEENSEEWE